MLASSGYPESSSTGDVITGVDVADALRRRARHPRRHGAAGRRPLVTAGGRVLAVIGTGADVAAARAAAYAGGLISFDGAQHRTTSPRADDLRNRSPTFPASCATARSGAAPVFVVSTTVDGILAAFLADGGR